MWFDDMKNHEQLYDRYARLYTALSRFWKDEHGIASGFRKQDITPMPACILNGKYLECVDALTQHRAHKHRNKVYFEHV